MNIESQVAFALDISLEVSHFEVIVYPVDNEVWEPWVFSSCLEKFVEKFKAFLPEVISKYFETHKRLILRKSLSEQSQAHIVDLIVCHVQVDQTLIDCNGLSNCLIFLCPMWIDPNAFGAFIETIT